MSYIHATAKRYAALEKVLEIRKLTKTYGEVRAVQDLSFEVKRGEVYGLLGPNGSGKSTTLGMILHVVNPTSGAWRWFGEKPDHSHLKRIGALIEQPNFYPYMTGYQNLELTARIKGVDKSKIQEKLEFVGLAERQNHKFKSYSLGMKQRLAIASALLNDPEVLILDEPTNGLDPMGIVDIRNLVLKIAKGGTTVIFASHILDEVEKICSHVLVLRNGKKIYSGRVDELNQGNYKLVLSSSDLASLKGVMKKFDSEILLDEHEGLLVAKTTKDVDMAALNHFCFENGVVLTHMSKAKPQLEENFVEMIKNQKDAALA